ncbi:MAG: S8 family peptidase [Chitinophagaceae bacterium]
MPNSFGYFRFKPVIWVTFLAAGIFTGCKKDLDQQSALQGGLVPDLSQGSLSANKEKVDKYNPNEILVKFKTGTSQDKKDKSFAKISGKVSEKILTKQMERAGEKDGVYLLHTSLDVLDALNLLKNQPDIEYAEPNYIYEHQAVATDPYFTNGSLWGMYGDATRPNNQFGSQAEEAWAAGNTGSTAVYVGIIDEGIQFTHPDLDGQVWTNSFDPVDGLDNDGNGYMDDTHGWDFDGNNNSTYDGGTRGSLDDHGTHVAGTIGAKSNNGTGVVGVNWNVTMISGKFLGKRGGTTANAVKAVDYFTDLKSRHGLNIVATNNSWGGGGFSQALYDAIERANDQGILFIAAAGNGGSDGVGDNNDTKASYPSNYDLANVIAVAAISNSGALATFSNFGSTTVDIGAPGVGIWSTTAFNGYSSYSGTSMATPHVTGGAALYAASHGGASAATIKSAILDSAVPTASLTGKTVTGGRLNVSGF